MAQYASIVRFAKIAILPLVFLAFFAYVRWWPTACQFPPSHIFDISGTPYRLLNIEQSCSMFDGGTQKIIANNRQNGEDLTIVKWFNITGDYDIFYNDGQLDIIIPDTIEIIERHPSIPDITVIYHWINVTSHLMNKDYLGWLEKPDAPEARAWALEHSTIH